MRAALIVQVSRFTRSRTVVAVFAGALGLSLGTAIALAAIPGTDGVIHGCYNNQSGALRIIDPTSASCRRRETAIAWNQAGLPGPQGPAGTSRIVCPGCFFLEDPSVGLSWQGSDFSQAYIPGIEGSNRVTGGPIHFDGANFTDAYMDSVQLGAASFVAANLTRAVFRSQLGGADFTNANLTDAVFSNTCVGLPVCNRNDLTNTVFVGAVLRGADLRDNNLSGANFTNADLTGGNLGSNVILTGVVWSNTICPDATNSNDNGGTCEGHLSP